MSLSQWVHPNSRHESIQGGATQATQVIMGRLHAARRPWSSSRCRPPLAWRRCRRFQHGQPSATAREPHEAGERDQRGELRRWWHARRRLYTPPIANARVMLYGALNRRLKLHLRLADLFFGVHARVCSLLGWI